MDMLLKACFFPDERHGAALLPPSSLTSTAAPSPQISQTPRGTSEDALWMPQCMAEIHMATSSPHVPRPLVPSSRVRAHAQLGHASRRRLPQRSRIRRRQGGAAVCELRCSFVGSSVPCAARISRPCCSAQRTVSFDGRLAPPRVLCLSANTPGARAAAALPVGELKRLRATFGEMRTLVDQVADLPSGITTDEYRWRRRPSRRNSLAGSSTRSLSVSSRTTRAKTSSRATREPPIVLPVEMSLVNHVETANDACVALQRLVEVCCSSTRSGRRSRRRTSACHPHREPLPARAAVAAAAGPQ